MSVELVEKFEQWIEQIRVQCAAKRSADLFGSHVAALKPELQKICAGSASKVSFDLAELGSYVLGALSVVTELAGQIKSAPTQISPIHPNLYRLVDLWGERVAIKAQLCDLFSVVNSETKLPIAALEARAEALLVGARELLLNAWRDASNLHGFEGYSALVAAALEGVSERAWSKLNGRVKSYLNTLAV